jgi:hypothetical protein
MPLISTELAGEAPEWAGTMKINYTFKAVEKPDR